MPKVDFTINTSGLALHVQALSINAEILGMDAENRQRIHSGQPIAYNDENFFNAARSLSIIAGQMKKMNDQLKEDNNNG